MLIQRNSHCCTVVDILEKLAPAIFAGDEAVRNNVRLLTGAGQLGIPSFVSRAVCVRGLGASLAAIRMLLQWTPIF